jgi:lipopolysaccharide transport system ATP-binding protein
MCSDEIVISASNLGKYYEIYAQPSHRLWQMLWRGRKRFFRKFWALRDVSFEIKRGQSLGIIGRNGAGKSTLLQILAGTLSQSTGSVSVNGKVAALLELGSGFNPEFTGRENVYLNATILGFSREDTDQRFDEIAAFADIGEYIDQPVKSYSSGMMLRLAFAVSACVDPDVLIIDEALAVGDMKFQVKCFDRIRKFKDEGGVFVLVSHDINTINIFCDQTCYLKNGNVSMLGKSRSVTTQYYNDMFNPSDSDRKDELIYAGLKKSRAIKDDFDFSIPNHDKSEIDAQLNELKIPDSKPEEIKKILTQPQELGDGSVRIIKYGLYDLNGNPVNLTNPDTEYVLHVRIICLEEIDDCSVGFLLRDNRGMHIYSTSTLLSEINAGDLKQNEIQDIFFKVCIPRVNFPYLIGIGLARSEGSYLDFLYDCIQVKAKSYAKAFGNSWMHVQTKTVRGYRWQKNTD